MANNSKKKVKFKKHGVGGMVQGGLNAVTGLAGIGFGISEAIKANKDIKELKKNPVRYDVDSSARKLAERPDEMLQYQKENALSSQAATLGAASKSGARGVMSVAASQSAKTNQAIRKAGLDADTLQREGHKLVSSIKDRNQAWKREDYAGDMAAAGARRSGGIRSAFAGAMGGAAGGGQASDSAEEAYGNYGGKVFGGGNSNRLGFGKNAKGGKIAGNKTNEDTDPLFLVNKKGEIQQDGKGRVITMRQGEFIRNEEQEDKTRKAVSYAAKNAKGKTKKDAKKMVKVTNSKRFN